MKELYEEMIKNYIYPFLKEYGYKKNKQYFYKHFNDIIYIFHFNLSNRNSSEITVFNINGMIYSKEIDKVIGNSVLNEPKNDDPQYNMKINDFPVAGYTIEQKTDITKMASEIIKGLENGEKIFSKIKTTDDLIRIMVIENYLYKYEEILVYLLKKNEIKETIGYIKTLYNRFRTENRWKIFEENINKTLSENKINKKLIELI